MIAPNTALELVRNELRTEVLAHVRDDGYAHSVLVAALGVLGEVAPRVREDDAWCEPSVRRLRTAAPAWSRRLTHAPEVGAHVAEVVGRSGRAPSLATERRLLLEAAEEVLAAMWGAPPSVSVEDLRGEVRELVAADAKLEVERGGRAR